MPDHSVSFDFDDKTVHFRSVSEDDHILGLMRHLGTFYESDVLLRIRDRLQARNRCGSAVDAGGFRDKWRR